MLLVDEVLAVGDEGFTHKCLDKFAEFRRRGKTILLVTHSLSLVERFCDEALWLDGGRAQRTAIRKRVVGAYLTEVEEGEETAAGRDDGEGGRRARRGQSAGTPPRETPAATRASTRRIRRSTCSRRPRDDGARARSKSPTSRCSIATGSRRSCSTPAIRWRSALQGARAAAGDDFVFGIGLFNADGVCCYGTNTYLEEMNPQRLERRGGSRRSPIESLDLVEGTYKLDVAVHKMDGFPYDYHRLLYTFRVKSRIHDVGIYRPAPPLDVLTGIQFKG